MNILRRLGLSLAVLVFSVGVSAFALLASLHFVIDTPEPLKQALVRSGIYDDVASNVLTQEAAASSSLPINDPGVRQALKDALPASFAQASSEHAVDSLYAWIQGHSASPDFSIDLTHVKTTFADNIAVYAKKKLEPLHACPYGALPPSSAEALLALTCMPRGLTADIIADRIRTEALDSQLLSNNNAITPGTLKNTQGQSLTDQLAFLPQLHTYYVALLYALPVALVLLAVAIIFWSNARRAGVKRVAWILVTTGITTVVLAVVQVWLLHAGLTIFGTPATASPLLQDKLLIVLEHLTIDLRTWWLGFGAGYIVLGSSMLITLAVVKPKHPLTLGEGTDYSKESGAYAPDDHPAPPAHTTGQH